MRRLILAVCLIASVWTFHLRHPDFKIKVKSLEFVNHPTALYQIDHLVPVDQIGKKAISPPHVSPRLTTATLNDFADQIFGNIQDAMVQNGMDPMQLPDIYQTFEFTLIITYEGHIELNNGWLSDVSTIHRSGDFVITYDPETRFLELTLDISFNDLIFTFDYVAEIMGLGPQGHIDGKVMDVELVAKIGFRVDDIALALDSFEVAHAGSIELNFSGDALLDWLLNLLSDVIMTLLHDVVLNLVGGFVSDALETLIVTLNEAIDGFLNPTTPVPATTVASIFKLIS